MQNTYYVCHPTADIKRIVENSALEKASHEICSMSRLLVATSFPNSDTSEQQSENGENDEDELLDENRLSASTAVGQQGVHFQQRHQHQWKKNGARVDGNNCQQHIKPLIKSPQHQLQPHHRLSHSSLTSGCKSMDFCYADER
ncbi:hypothetical protein GHT06_021582 [Daphnia sinensis]|uniref:Uncharacterized protein n=1 Tax=Daphnia sinensis TaxID=1820382 RepID=A0AAD5L1R0_9CRUS|nr:hypothetical protein GHT06_021582 [Daphnia sinensis]